jgi:hypothetical protein
MKKEIEHPQNPKPILVWTEADGSWGIQCDDSMSYGPVPLDVQVPSPKEVKASCVAIDKLIEALKTAKLCLKDVLDSGEAEKSWRVGRTFIKGMPTSEKEKING